jgi:hypothetical protein
LARSQDETLFGHAEVFGKKVPPMPPVLRSIDHMVGENFVKIFGTGESSTFSKFSKSEGVSSARANISKILGKAGSSSRAGFSKIKEVIGKGESSGEWSVSTNRTLRCVKLSVVPA